MSTQAAVEEIPFVEVTKDAPWSITLITHVAEAEASGSTPPPVGPKVWAPSSSKICSPDDKSFLGWDPARVDWLSKISPLMPELKNYYSSPTVSNISGLPDHVQKACETPIRAWTTELEDAIHRPTSLETMRLGLVHHGRSLVLLENSYSRMAKVHVQNVKFV